MARRSWAGCWGSVVMAAALGCTGLGGTLTPLVHAAPQSEPAADFDDLVNRAAKQRTEGKHAAAARSYAQAYRVLPEAKQVDLMGEVTIDNALADYRQAYEQQPAQVVLLEELSVLLAEFIERRTQAHESHRAEAVPERIEQELVRLRAEIDRVNPEPEVEPEPEVGPEPEVEPKPEVEPEFQPTRADSEQTGAPATVGDAPSGTPPRSLEPGPVDGRTASRGVDAAILATGVAALLGGAAFIGGGAWNFATLNEQKQARQDALAAGIYSDDRRERFLAELASWEDRWRGKSTGLIVAGSVLAGAGVGLAAWGAVRLRKSGRGEPRRAKLELPVVIRGGAGVAMTVTF